VGCPSDPPAGGDTESTTTTATSPATAADTTESGGPDCGNEAIDGEEECDGLDLGGAECTDVDPAYTGGTLACGASCTFDASACTLAPDTALVAINEVTSEAVLTGDFAGPNDAIELYNAGDVAADISGWQLSDDPTLPPDKTYVLPSGTMLEPGDYLVLLSLDELSMTGELPFGVSDSSLETLSLADADGTAIDYVAVDGYLARESYCRVPDGSGAWFQCVQTFGGENQAADTACGNGVAEDLEACDGRDLAGATCESLGLGYAGGSLSCSPTCKLETDGCTTDSELVLNELSSITDDIEIFNGSAVDVDLTGLVLTDDEVGADYAVSLDTAELVFPAGTVLAPGEYLVIPPGLGPGQHPFGLGAMGDRVTLLDPSPLTIIDQVTYGAGQADVSWCRLPNGPGGEWQACLQTLGGPNMPP
jgi:Lamin Tail Domain